MTLIHHSNAPLTEVRSVSQNDAHMKPQGLWVSVKGKNDWRQWCESEDFNVDRLAVETLVALSPDANILHISGPFHIDAFTQEYGTGNGYEIDWQSVADKYDGIIIAPYCWERRMSEHTPWYYTWDCASGCIWNARAIASLQPMEVLAVQGKA